MAIHKHGTYTNLIWEIFSIIEITENYATFANSDVCDPRTINVYSPDKSIFQIPFK